MTTQRTLSIIKPDAVKRDLIGKIYTCIEAAGLKIIGQRMVRLTLNQAREFYAVHKERPFYNDLVEYMTSGPVVVACLEGANAVAKYREVMGATNPKNAADGTIRKLYAESLQNNSVHGSDSADNAKIEISFFFKDEELCGR